MKCKNKDCGIKFTPTMQGQRTHDYKCAIELAIQDREKKQAKEERKVKKETRERLKSRNDWLKEAEALVNRYVRIRDAHLGCVSCDKPATWGGQWHASHFRSVGAASAIRFNLWNIHKACSICNRHLSGNIGEYEPRLRIKIGNKKVDWLRSQNHRADYPIEYIQRLINIFKRKIKNKGRVKWR